MKNKLDKIKVIDLLEAGQSIKQIAERMGVYRYHIYNAITKKEIEMARNRYITSVKNIYES